MSGADSKRNVKLWPPGLHLTSVARCASLHAPVAASPKQTRVSVSRLVFSLIVEMSRTRTRYRFDFPASTRITSGAVKCPSVMAFSISPEPTSAAKSSSISVPPTKSEPNFGPGQTKATRVATHAIRLTAEQYGATRMNLKTRLNEKNLMGRLASDRALGKGAPAERAENLGVPRLSQVSEPGIADVLYGSQGRGGWKLTPKVGLQAQ